MSAQVTLTGRLVRDPELKFSNAGKAIAKFSIVTSDRVRNKDTQEWEDANTSFWDCTAFDALAENLCENFRQGNLVIAVGKMRQENWEKDGQKRSAFRVVVSRAGIDQSMRQSKSTARRVAATHDDEKVPF